MKENKVALVVVDPQIDFFPGGALGAPKAGQIIKPVNTLLNKGRKNRLPHPKCIICKSKSYVAGNIRKNTYLSKNNKEKDR